ncbi:hypothetical protein FSP39_008840 [Pinctada imbricata]|uniref:Uncharacterized protein n=1 Tax=Pinctada imbricata TaxID=66713 RepID=A0AA88XTB3_PINIB|nr:hypothetical protein FSP39_008840 [Pinctada imbricata]
MKEKEIDKDTVVAYHDYIQRKIRAELNSVCLGPAQFYGRLALGIFLFGLASGIVGILLVTLRHRHVYLVSWDDQFLGPFFIILFLLCTMCAVYLVLYAKRKANKYRRELVFRPIGDYGVAVVHKSRLTYEQTAKETLKSGTAPHRPDKPKPYSGRPRGPAGYRGPPPGYDPRPGGPPGRYPDDRKRYGPPDDRRRPPDDRRRHPDDRGRYDDRRRYGPPDDRYRRPPPDDRYGDPGERRRPPPDDRYMMERDEKRRMYEEDRRRRYEEQERRQEKPIPPPGYPLRPPDQGRPGINLKGVEEGDESSF